MAEKSNSFELRSRSMELLRLPVEVALGSPEVVRKLRQHDLFCRFLNLGTSSPFMQLKSSQIVDEALSASLQNQSISDRILSCVEAPQPCIVDLRQPKKEPVGSHIPIVTGDDEGAPARPEEETASPGGGTQ